MAIKVRKKDPNKEEDPEKQEENAPAQQAAAPDPFLNATTSTASWIEENRGLALGGLALVIIAIMGGFGVMEYMKSQGVKASAHLTPAFSAYETPVSGSPELDTLSEAGITIDETHANSDEQWNKVLGAANATLEAKKKGPLVQSARLTKGAAAVRLEKWDDAISAYEDFLAADHSEDIAPFVHQALASAYAGKGDVESARAQLDKLSEAGENYEEIANFQEAIILDNAGETDKAKDLYHGILEANPESPYKSEIERRLALL
ncbi:MAG: tetratricopeptide repeat protein [Myxococcota bacterium]